MHTTCFDSRVWAYGYFLEAVQYQCKPGTNLWTKKCNGKNLNRFVNFLPLLLVMMTYTQPVFPPLNIALTDIHFLDTYPDLNHNLYLPNPNPNLWAGNNNSCCGDLLTGSCIPMWLCFRSLLLAVSINRVCVCVSVCLSLLNEKTWHPLRLYDTGHQPTACRQPNPYPHT